MIVYSECGSDAVSRKGYSNPTARQHSHTRLPKLPKCPERLMMLTKKCDEIPNNTHAEIQNDLLATHMYATQCPVQS